MEVFPAHDQKCWVTFARTVPAALPQQQPDFNLTKEFWILQIPSISPWFSVCMYAQELQSEPIRREWICSHAGFIDRLKRILCVQHWDERCVWASMMPLKDQEQLKTGYENVKLKSPIKGQKQSQFSQITELYLHPEETEGNAIKSQRLRLIPVWQRKVNLDDESPNHTQLTAERWMNMREEGRK